MNKFVNFISVCKCGTIEVTLSEKSKRAISIPELAGLYEESATVNGRSSWISADKRYAIWYHPDFKVSRTEKEVICDCGMQIFTSQ